MRIIEVAVWLLPGGRLKNRLLRLFGHSIARSAHIGPILVLDLQRAVIGENCRINTPNVFRSLRLLELGEGASIGQLNSIGAFPGFRQLDPNFGFLVMERGACITSRHYIDCSGGVQMGKLSALYGHRTTLLTHEIDMSTNESTAGTVSIGERSAVLTNCVVLKGAYLPPRSVLAANATLIKARDPNPAAGLYAGTPAKRIGPVIAGADSWFERDSKDTTKFRVDPPVIRQIDGLA